MQIPEFQVLVGTPGSGVRIHHFQIQDDPFGRVGNQSLPNLKSQTLKPLVGFAWQANRKRIVNINLKTVALQSQLYLMGNFNLKFSAP